MQVIGYAGRYWAGRSGEAKPGNPSNVGLPIRVTPAEFTQAPDGTLTFHPVGETSAASWVRLNTTQLYIRPGDTGRVEVTVTVPDKAEPGERYIGLLFKTPSQAARGNIQIEKAIAAQLLINVPGPVVHHIDFGPLHAPAFSIGGPITLDLTVRNHGTMHQAYEQPRPLVADASGDRVAFPAFLVLRDSTRTVQTQWRNPPLLCLCTVSVTTDDGQGHRIIRQARILIIPLPQIAGVLIAALGLFLLARTARRHHTRRLEAARRQGYDQAVREQQPDT